VARQAGGGCSVIPVAGALSVAVCPCLLGLSLPLLLGASASAGAIRCRCGGARARRCVVLILILAWFIIVAHWIGCWCWRGVARRRPLASEIHPVSSFSQGW
jgi:hypothetical protein